MARRCWCALPIDCGNVAHGGEHLEATWVSPQQEWTGEVCVEVRVMDSGSHVTSDLGDEQTGEMSGSF